jgi:uncharacterized protein YdhG (YjbR/CyaY superfamily)
MPTRSTFTSVDDYIAKSPPAAQKVLKKLRALIRTAAPKATERISYGIPVFELNGRYLVYLAGWQKHISLYPVTAGLAQAFKKEIAPHRSGKGTLQFPLDKPMPTDLIRRIVKFRVEELAAAPSRGRKKKPPSKTKQPKIASRTTAR